MDEQNNTLESADLIEKNKQLRLELKKLNRQLNLANDNMIKYKSVTSAKANLSAVIASEKSKQEKQLQVIMENSPDIIILLDRGMNILLSTRSFLNLAGVPCIGFLHHKSFKQIFSSFSNDAEIIHMEDIFRKALETNEIQSTDEQFFVGAQQMMRQYSINIIPFFYNDEKNDGLLIIFHDMTERIEMENKIKEALNDATVASKAKGDFLSNMSHEMRTPMNAIIGMTNIGKKAHGIKEKDLALNKIGDAASHLLGVINDVLDMAKIEANKLELTPVEFNFEKMLQKVSSVISFRVDEKQQHLFINIDNSVPRYIVGDDQRLAQVITNLLSNAIKFTHDEGKISLNVFFTGGNENNCELRIEVADNGIGITPEQQKKLFIAFEQAESGTSRKYGGTGLGLVITKRIIELMEGKIWVESELGKGSRFIFTIKAERGNQSAHTMLLPGVNWNNLRIMVVDGMIEIRNQFQNLFDYLDIKCDVVGDGFEAWQILEERGEYDVYFIDWQTHKMDGIELAKKIKSCSKSRSRVVIMTTALDWDHTKNDALKAGVDKHLLKPLFSSAIIDCVNECLGVENIKSGEKREIDPGKFEGKRLLLAEDIEINREILLALLEDTGIIIDCATNGQEALDMISAAPCKYDIVFMDMQMPQMDGLEATRLIRALPALQNSKLPIIAMTANVFMDDIEACRSAGMDDHIGKPLETDKVMEKLRKYLERSNE